MCMLSIVLGWSCLKIHRLFGTRSRQIPCDEQRPSAMTDLCTTLECISRLDLAEIHRASRGRLKKCRGVEVIGFERTVQTDGTYRHLSSCPMEGPYTSMELLLRQDRLYLVPAFGDLVVVLQVDAGVPDRTFFFLVCVVLYGGAPSWDPYAFFFDRTSSQKKLPS